MSFETQSRNTETLLLDGGIAGIISGVITGLILYLGINENIISKAVPAMIGLRGQQAVIGWILYLITSVIVGLVYAWIDMRVNLTEYTRTISSGIISGAIYGVAVWLIFAVVVIPLWLSTVVEFADSPSFPFISGLALIGYVIFGLIIGGVYGASPASSL
ncbi:MAG: hypothetical protein ABEI06_04320 [Halobacteriaceae archaeon]